MGVDELKFETTSEWAEVKRDNPWLEFVPEWAEGRQGQRFMRGRGRSAVYRVVKSDGQNEEYACAECGSEIMAKIVAHAIWDGPEGSCSGSGKCEYESVPYCPKCEEKPNFHGTPARMSLGESIARDLF